MEPLMRTQEQALDILTRNNFKTPPEKLRVWVGGATEEIFTAVGRNVALNLFDVIEPLNLLKTKENTVLDFGCGCGRVIQNLRALYPNCTYYGVDPDSSGIQWCQENLNDIGTFIKSSTRPPLNLNVQFDFIYATSVFTHLPEDLQFDWLTELTRITKVGGYLVLTTHGELLDNSVASLRDEEKKNFLEKGFWYRDSSYNPIGKDYYDVVWHTKEYVAKHWSKYFQIVKHIDKGINNHQDLILCKKIK
jgi:trans-aconitate methyltransferase